MRCIETDGYCAFCNFWWASELWFRFRWLTNKKLFISQKIRLSSLLSATVRNTQCFRSYYCSLANNTKAGVVGACFRCLFFVSAWMSRVKNCPGKWPEMSWKCPGNILKFHSLKSVWTMDEVNPLRDEVNPLGFNVTIRHPIMTYLLTFSAHFFYLSAT